MHDERRIYDMIGDLRKAGPGQVFSPAVLDRNHSSWRTAGTAALRPVPTRAVSHARAIRTTARIR
jgi:hypothetical protein